MVHTKRHGKLQLKKGTQVVPFLMPIFPKSTFAVTQIEDSKTF